MSWVDWCGKMLKGLNSQPRGYLPRGYLPRGYLSKSITTEPTHTTKPNILVLQSSTIVYSTAL